MEKEIVQFSFILYRCAIAFRNELNKGFQKEFGEDLTVDFWYVLTALWEEDNLSHNLLATRVSRDKASLSRTLDIMEAKGLVKRASALNDRRSSMIALTHKANDMRVKANEVAASFTQNELKGLSAIEVKELMRMIDHLYSNVRHE
jgi:DNA-binding MarR family transcriptional regulator